MENGGGKPVHIPNHPILRSEKLLKYILESSVYPREPEPLRELRNATDNHPLHFIAASPDVGQLIALLLKLLSAKKTIEVGVFTGYSLLLTALNIPDDGKIIAMDPARNFYELGLPFIKKAGVEHKIDFLESPAMPVLDKLLEDPANEGSFDFAFVDADKDNYWNYHERLMKLVRIGGIIAYDNTLWGGSVAMPEEEVPEQKREWRKHAIAFNKAIAEDSRVELAFASIGDGLSICRRLR
ncbi:probable caffeoyl-CoA O-methyltransferase At4g26220 [Neltuma alba]|uniref:probable caffeoyl-CoA O-methyltransferase At4g26220 n=1 Tax=Neltuma alba TaxID=207710 RepID=UPI0010A34A79|nr:probable caffeoyl-CoA O-methyltransferase At4g26220 [Prosopis alba]